MMSSYSASISHQIAQAQASPHFSDDAYQAAVDYSNEQTEQALGGPDRKES
jgi:hypothetical protein